MKNGGVFHQRAVAPDRADDWPAFLRRFGEAINQAATLEELFRRAAEAVHEVWPDHAVSLAMRHAEAKFIRTQFVACQGQFFTPTTQMSFRRFCRVLKLPDGRRYLEQVPNNLWPLLFPDLARVTPTNLPFDLKNDDQNLQPSGLASPELLREYPSRQSDSNGAFSDRPGESERDSTAFTGISRDSPALLAPLRDLSGLAGAAFRSQSVQNGKATTFLNAVSAAKPEPLFGCIAILSRQGKAFLPGDGDCLITLADLLMAGIHKVQLLQERARTMVSFRQFVSLGEEMGTVTDLDAALQKIAQAAVRILSIPVASITIFELTTVGDWDHSTLSHLDGKGGFASGESLASPQATAQDGNLQMPGPALADWPRFPLRATRGIIKRLLRKQPIVVYDVARSRIFSETAKTLLAQHQIRSYFGMPIFLDARAGQNTNTCATPLALLSLYAQAPHELEALDRTMLQALAAHAAQVLTKLRLHHQLEKSKAYFDGLRRGSMEELENFVYVISHNLKTPVVSIQGFANILQEEVGPGLELEHRHFLERIQKNAAAMEKMVLDLLEFSRLGRTAPKRERVNVKALVQSVIDEMCLLETTGKVEFVFPRQAAEPPSLLADSAELKIVFDNLINNAAKYRRPGVPLRIEIGWEEQPRFHVFWVRDNGMGMDAAFQAKAFDLFQRGPNVGQISGTGVGLAIVRRIVENHQGLVRLHSKLGEGTTVYFTLPKIEAPSSGNPAETALTH